MSRARSCPPQALGGLLVLAVRDYKEGIRRDLRSGRTEPSGLPASNVLYYELEDNAWCCIRPSGTEPKIKYYFGVKGKSLEDAAQKLEALKQDLTHSA